MSAQAIMRRIFARALHKPCAAAPGRSAQRATVKMKDSWARHRVPGGKCILALFRIHLLWATPHILTVAHMLSCLQFWALGVWFASETCSHEDCEGLPVEPSPERDLG